METLTILKVSNSNPERRAGPQRIYQLRNPEFNSTKYYSWLIFLRIEIIKL